MKNTLQNVHGYSPYQLVFGKKPSLPAFLSDRPPALDETSSTTILRDNLNALHRAREAFIESESSEKLRRALNHNIRSSGDIKYITGDRVYYKRLANRKWCGPAVVLGQDGQQVLVKHGGIYVRVHPCRLCLEDTSKQPKVPKSNTNRVSKESDGHNCGSSSDSETDDCRDDVTAAPDKLSNIDNDHMNAGVECSPTTSEELQPAPEARSSLQDPHKILKIGTNIQYKFYYDEDWSSAKLISRAGKSTGKYKNEWNVDDPQRGQCVVNFDRVEWHKALPLSSVNMEALRRNETTEEMEILQNEIMKEDLTNAKKSELDSWKKHQVYDEVENTGQKCISVRWVITPKLKNGQLYTKARLCARGFEELSDFRTDSPTCMRESVRACLCIIATNSWKLHSIDFKTAFLQGKPIERDVYLKPPKECRTNMIWRLRKTVYGLADAPRVWFLRLKEELVKSGAQMSTYDQGLFSWHRFETLEGIIVCFVDDLLWGGTQHFENNIIKNLRDAFDISREDSTVFKYIGIDLEQNSDMSVIISQTSYLRSIDPIYVSRVRQLQKTDPLTEQEVAQLRRAIGQMNWVAGISRPDISFSVCEASTNIKHSTVDSLLRMNKIIKYVKNNDSQIVIPKFNSLTDLRLCVYTDASFANLPNGASQGGHIVFLTDSDGHSCPLSWQSTKVKRVVKSTLAAETLALVDGSDNAFLMSKLIAEIIYNKKKSHLPIECRTDNKSLFQAANTFNI